MKNILVYDDNDLRIQELCDVFNATEYEIIEGLLDALDSGAFNLEDYI